MGNQLIRPYITKPLSVQHVKTTEKKQLQATSKKFSTHFQEAIIQQSHLNVSKHAQQRLEQRNITIDKASWNQIEKKVSEAKRMGVNDSLVLLKDAALIVSAKNNTVITAMDRREATSQIFTNINGTIIIENE